MSTLPEEQVQAAAIELFTVLGWTVLQTSRRGIFCQRCHRRVYGPDGATKGVPDLFVSRKGWDRWIGIEVKGPKTKVSPEQQQLVDAGQVCLVRSIDEAIELEKMLRT